MVAGAVLNYWHYPTDADEDALREAFATSPLGSV